MRNWIDKVYQPAGFVLLGVLIGAGFTLVIQGRVATSDIVLGVVYLLAIAVILVNKRNNNALFYFMLCLLGTVMAIAAWTHHRSSFGVCLWGFFSLIYAYSARQAHIKQKKARTDQNLSGTSLAAQGLKSNY